jgi:hypothetical protein
MSIKLKILVLVFNLLFMSSVSATAAMERVQISGITLKMNELAKDGEHEIYSEERFRKVDANATLQLTFVLPPRPEELETSPEWITLIEILFRLKQAEIRYRELAEKAKELVANGTAADQNFIDESDKARHEATSILRLMVTPNNGEPLISQDTLNKLILSDPEHPYKVLIAQINKSREELHTRAVWFAGDADKYTIIVRAYLLPKLGGREALHIEGYDNLPQGDFRPLDPTGLLPAPQEAKRLAGELESAGKVSRAIEEIRKNGDLILNEVQQMFENLDESLKSLEIQLRDELNQLPKDFKEVIEEQFLDKLEQIDTPNDESKQLAKEMREVRNDLEELQKIADSIQELRNMARKVRGLNSLRQQDIEDIFNTIEKLQTLIKNVLKRIGKWDDKLDKISNLAPITAEAAADETLKLKLTILKQKWKQALIGMHTRLRAKLPATANAVSVVVTFLKNSSDIVSSVSELGKTDPEYIPHPLKDLPPAELDLRYAGVTLGDQVMVTVDLRRIGESQSTEQTKAPDAIYKVETTLAGWHRRLSGDVMFTKTVEGPTSSRFQGNIGVSYEWHNYKRDDPNGLWNQLDSGFGFHATLLSQDPNQNVEFGIGVNISFFDGLIGGGYGYNLSVSENNQYWFISFGLISALGKLKSVGTDLFAK